MTGLLICMKPAAFTMMMMLMSKRVVSTMRILLGLALIAAALYLAWRAGGAGA